VLTYRFLTTVLKGDPSVIGKTVRLGTRSATIVGVLEPSVPYPAANRDHCERGDKPASPLGDDGDRARPSHDGAFWTALPSTLTLQRHEPNCAQSTEP